MRVQAGVVQNLDTTRTQIDALVSSSQSATGALQAAQSGNQLVALQTKQLADLTAVMAAIARAQSLDGARNVESQAQAQQQLYKLPQLRRRATSPAPRRCSTDARPSAQHPRDRPRGRLRRLSPRRSSRPRIHFDRDEAEPRSAHRSSRGHAAIRSPRELARCQAIGMAAKDDAACEAAWAENRRRFFTYRPADSGRADAAGHSCARQTRGSVGAMGGTGVIDNFLGIFTQYIDSGFGLVQGDVRWLAGVLIAIDITLAGLFWAMAPDEDVLARLIKKTLYIGVFAFIIGNFNNLAQIIYNSFAGLGIEAGGGTMTARRSFFSPAGSPRSASTPASRSSTSISGLMGFTSFFDNFVQIAILLIAWLIVVISFFIMAIQLFVSLIEFKLTTLAGFVLVPFGLFGRTAFLAEKVLGNVVSSGVKILVLAVIVGIGSTIFGQFTSGFNNPPTICDALTLILAALVAARPDHLRPRHRQRPDRRRPAARRRRRGRHRPRGRRHRRGRRGARRRRRSAQPAARSPEPHAAARPSPAAPPPPIAPAASPASPRRRRPPR